MGPHLAFGAPSSGAPPGISRAAIWGPTCPATLIRALPRPAASHLGLVADSHDHLAELRHVAAAFADAGVAFVVHAGDVAEPSSLRVLSAFDGAVVVGNNDDESALRAAAQEMGWACGATWEATLADRRVAAAHGHDRGAVTRLLASRPDVLVVGHSHREPDERGGSSRRDQPRRVLPRPRLSAASVDLATGGLLRVPKAAPGC